jgi:voltage-gated potassium channel
LYIISRSIDDHAHEKLTRAGADRTISPNEIGGRRMAALMLQPTVISFLDLITRAGDIELDLDEVVLFSGSDFISKTLREARIPDKTGLVILAIQKRGSNQMIFNPGSETVLEEGDSMIVLGTSERVL